MMARHSSLTDTTATVAVHGLASPLRVLHLSDSHISLSSDNAPHSDRMHHAFIGADGDGTPHRSTGEVALPTERFQGQVEVAAQNGTDLIIHTGDFLNFPSVEAVAFAHGVLARSGLPWLYCSGNHDWHYEGLHGSSEALRTEWRQRSLDPLYGERSPDNWVDDSPSGIRFIGIDNSTYQVSQAQLAFFQAHATADERPIVLLVHIPLYLEELADTLGGGHRSSGVALCGDPRWGEASDAGYETEQRQRWPKEGNAASTMAFLTAVAACKNLVAVLAGARH